jgi:hypothetical protein
VAQAFLPVLVFLALETNIGKNARATPPSNGAWDPFFIPILACRARKHECLRHMTHATDVK